MNESRFLGNLVIFACPCVHSQFPRGTFPTKPKLSTPPGFICNVDMVKVKFGKVTPRKAKKQTSKKQKQNKNKTKTKKQKKRKKLFSFPRA